MVLQRVYPPDGTSYMEFDLLGITVYREPGRELLETKISDMAERRLDDLIEQCENMVGGEDLTFHIHGPMTHRDASTAMFSLGHALTNAIVKAFVELHSMSMPWSCLQVSNVNVNEGLLEVLRTAQALELFPQVAFDEVDSIAIVFQEDGLSPHYWNSVRLSRLDMGICPMTQLGKFLRPQSARPAQLESLELRNLIYGAQHTSILADGLAANDSLISLTLTSRSSMELANIFAAIQSHATLKSLSLSMCNLAFDAVQNLARTLSENYTLERLSLVRCSQAGTFGFDHDVLLDGIRSNRSLVSLTLRWCGLTNNHLQGLFETFHTCPALKELDLSFNQLGTATQRESKLCDGIVGHTSLENFSLRATGIGVDTVRQLVSVLHTCPNLKEVDLSQNDLEGLDLTNLSPTVPVGKQLLELNLGRCYQQNRRRLPVLDASLKEVLQLFPALSVISDNDIWLRAMPPSILHQLILNYAGRGKLGYGAGAVLPISLWPLILNRVEVAVSRIEISGVEIAKGRDFRTCWATILFGLISNNPTEILQFLHS